MSSQSVSSSSLNVRGGAPPQDSSVKTAKGSFSFDPKMMRSEGSAYSSKSRVLGSASSIVSTAKGKLTSLSSSESLQNYKQKLSNLSQSQLDLREIAKERTIQVKQNAFAAVDFAKEKVKALARPKETPEPSDIVWIDGPVKYIEQQRKEYEEKVRQQQYEEEEEEKQSSHPHASWKYDARPAYAQQDETINPLKNENEIFVTNTSADSDESYPFVIVGFGVSGGYAARQFSNLGVKEDQVCIIGEEPFCAYERPALSKGYLFPSNGEKKPVRLPAFYCGSAIDDGKEIQTEKWYSEKGWPIHLSTKVIEVNPKDHTIKCSDNRTIGYQKLIVCTGSKPRKLTCPGSQLKHVFYIRNERDVDRLVKGLELTTKRKHATVIGGGYLGVEMATSLTAWGFSQVALVCRSDHLFHKMTWTEKFRQRLESEICSRAPNLKVYTNSSVKMLVPKPDDEAVLGGFVLDDGTVVNTQVIICCIGATANGRELFSNIKGMHDAASLKIAKDVWICGELSVPDCGVEAAREMGMYAAQNAYDECKGIFNHSAFSIASPFHYSKMFEFTKSPLIWYQIGQISTLEDLDCQNIGNSNSSVFGTFYFKKATGKTVKAAIISGNGSDIEFLNDLRICIESETINVDQIIESFTIKGYSV